MQDFILICPMFAMVLLTFSTLVRLFRARTAAVAAGVLKASYFYVYQDGMEPELPAKLSRHFINQFEAPVLFYVCCVAAMAAHAESPALSVLAWIYVLLRLVHTFVHTGKNRLKPRILAYLCSWAVLLLMWLVLLATALSS